MGANSARLAHLGADPDSWASGRRRYLDNLKVLLIAAIIAGHAVVGYADLNWWPYAEMREVSLSPVTQTIMFATLAPATLMLIPTLFLVAGLLTPGSLQRKGAGAFARNSTLAVWVFAAAQRHLDRPFRLAPPAVVRSAYAAFIVQVVVLLGLAVALSAVPLPAEIKAIVVAVGGVIGSFGLAWLLLRSSPGLRRIL